MITNEKLRDYEAAKEELKRFQTREALKPFVDEMLNGIGIILCTTPFDKWPKIAQDAFHFYSASYPVPSKIYKENLPKEI